MADDIPLDHSSGVAMGVAIHARLEAYISIHRYAYQEVPMSIDTHDYVGGYEVLVYGYKGVVGSYRESPRILRIPLTGNA